MCGVANASVRAADVYHETKEQRQVASRERRRAERRHAKGDAPKPPPDSPGVVLRPCCDPAAVHAALRAPLPEPTCALDRVPVLANWLLGAHTRASDAVWATKRADLARDLGPNCKEVLPRYRPLPPGDDDDREDQEITQDDDDGAAVPADEPPAHRAELRR